MHPKEMAPTFGVGAKKADDVDNDDLRNRHQQYSKTGSRSKADSVAERPAPLSAEQVINAIVSYCGGGERAGKDWKCNCPICGKHSLSITFGQKIAIVFQCWHFESTGLDGHTEQREYFINGAAAAAAATRVDSCSLSCCILIRFNTTTLFQLSLTQDPQP
jgi:hypothetical protein